MSEIKFELFNNTLIQQLVGPQDCHLRLLEKILSVEIGSFGNQITIKGPKDAVEQAKTAIDVLYHKVSKGIEINEQEVKAAVRLSNEGNNDSVSAQDLSDIVLKTKKRHICQREPLRHLLLPVGAPSSTIFRHSSSVRREASQSFGIS